MGRPGVVRRVVWVSLVTTAAGCGGGSPLESTREQRHPVESDQLGAIYDLAFEPAPPLSKLRAATPDAGAEALADAWVAALAAQAMPYWSSASITVPALDPGGEHVLAPQPAQSRIRYSCGATLIAPSYAITAGHCVTDSDSDVSELRLQAYRPSAALAEAYVPPPLTGTFPLYEHAELEAADYGYDEFPCSIVTRCYSSEYTQDCPDLASDVALLRCEGYPGDVYGFLDVTSAPLSGREALMHWKHEVYDVGLPGEQSADVLEHYVEYGPPELNYHYFEAGNQLLPLRSIPWSDGTPTQWVSESWADVHGCHGSSGSGMLARVAGTAAYELAGPAANGGAAFEDRLCQRHPTALGTPSGPGTLALGIDWTNRQAWLAPWQADLVADCAERRAPARDPAFPLPMMGSHQVSTVFSHLSCQVSDFAREGAPVADPALGPYPERYVDGSDGSEAVATGFSLEADADYRFGVHAVPLAACSGDCGGVRLRVDSTEVTTPLDGSLEAKLVTHLFAAPSAGGTTLGVSSTGQGRSLGALVLIREGRVNTFDSPEDRLEAALYAVDGGAAVLGPAPMRFTSDGVAGFAALLYSGERMALLRQAIAPGRVWTVRLALSDFVGLSCGLLDMTGAPVVTAPCAPLLHIDDRAGTTGRLGFFIERQGSAPGAVTVFAAALASDAARDLDGDAIPEVLDNCPGDWNAAQGDCDEEPPPPPVEAGADVTEPDASNELDSGVKPDDGGASSAQDAATAPPPLADARPRPGADASNPGATSPEAGASGGKPSSGSGCGCRVGGTSGRRPSMLRVLATALGVLALRRPHRRRQRDPAGERFRSRTSQAQAM